MNVKTIYVSLMLVVGAALSTSLFAQTQPHSHDHATVKTSPAAKAAPMPGMKNDKMMADCTAMMQKKEQMKSDMKAMEDKLDAMLATVNTSVGAEKTEAIAAVVNEMIQQGKAMRAKMAAMDEEMMKHMMEHMSMGKDSMMMCPMMKPAPALTSDAPKPEDHSNHQEDRLCRFTLTQFDLLKLRPFVDWTQP